MREGGEKSTPKVGLGRNIPSLVLDSVKKKQDDKIPINYAFLSPRALPSTQSIVDKSLPEKKLRSPLALSADSISSTKEPEGVFLTPRGTSSGENLLSRGIKLIRRTSSRELSSKTDNTIPDIKNSTSTPATPRSDGENEFSPRKNNFSFFGFRLSPRNENKINKRNILITNFRDAESPKARKKAAIAIVNQSDLFEENYLHFLKLANDMVANREKYENNGYFVNPILPLDRKDQADEVYTFMLRLAENSTKSLTARTDSLIPPGNIVCIGVNFVNDDKKDGAYTRKVGGIKEFLNECNTAVCSIEKVTALLEVITVKYPLTMHLITPLEESIASDYRPMFKHGSYFKERDSEFAQRWIEHQGLKKQFKIELNNFISLGMENPDKFEDEMRNISKIVAGFYIKDLIMMPDDEDRKYGTKTREQAIEKIKTHVSKLQKNEKFLATALKKAELYTDSWLSAKIDEQTQQSEGSFRVVGKHTSRLEKEKKELREKGKERKFD
ncbi:hypothetical protein I862_03680 [endosymbiont of Acanthamoeba sp. UWC8]|uniref:hypothetical protein n=1 Tax=endosymbiont of Acanthamoeba sp. UWC8 TaxID=86106 RepID=UPI0004D147E9|nr:hypothetical protein [endosymbiont of Acanthamoeba sp. UWC8]AIF81296.1 hypothetical protein I862_03680 [endosymbiont of Acanthamoeba sp. UWC8]